MAATIFFMPINEATFAPPAHSYHFEVAAGVYKPVERLVQLHLHYTAASAGTTAFFVVVAYLMGFNPAVHFSRAAYMVLIGWVDVQTHLAKVFLLIAINMNVVGATQGKISQLLNAVSEVEKTFAGLFFQPDKVRALGTSVDLVPQTPRTSHTFWRGGTPVATSLPSPHCTRFPP